MFIRRFSWVFIVILLFLLSQSVLAVGRTGWKTKEIDLNAGSGRQIKAIHYPEGKEVHTKIQKKTRIKKKLEEKKQRPAKPNQLTKDSVSTHPAKVSTGTVMVNTIESPPINGFIPWIAVAATDERMDDGDINAYVEDSLVGDYLPDNTQGDYVIGLFDTGASAHVMGYESSQTLGVGEAMDTGNVIEIKGVTGAVDAWVTYPLGIYIAGLSAINPASLTLDTSELVGQSNVSIAVGFDPELGAPDLPTAIGSPMSVFYDAVFKNDHPITIHRNGKNYTAPEIQIYLNKYGNLEKYGDPYEYEDPDEYVNPNVPVYPIDIPLELRPAGAGAVSFMFNGLDEYFEPIPSSPSIIIGNLSQSLFFVHAVDVYDNGHQAFDKDRFMIDTGAQVTVIGKRIAARLGIDPAKPEFIVDIEGVSGQISEIGGYYIDEIEIPALGEWVSFTNVPVILLDIASPEGGTLDGIIGMNLFNDYNMVLRGSGMFLEDAPSLQLELITTPPITLAGDIAPNPVDGTVDMLDMTVCMQAWLSSSGDTNFNHLCDIAPESLSDGIINLQDVAMIAANWLKQTPTQ